MLTSFNTYDASLTRFLLFWLVSTGKHFSAGGDTTDIFALQGKRYYFWDTWILFPLILTFYKIVKNTHLRP